MEIKEFLDHCFLDIRAILDKTKKIDNDRLYIAVNKNDDKRLLIKLSDIINVDELLLLKNPLINSMLKGLIK